MMVSEKEFMFRHRFTKGAENENYHLHNHSDSYEILLYMCGDAEFVVEGSRYKMSPYDIVIASDFEMHLMDHKSKKDYERIVINVDKSFFTNRGCENYKKVFTERVLGENNLIPYETAKQAGLIDALFRIEEYLSDYADLGVAASAAFTEFLYMLNRVGMTDTKEDKPYKKNEQIKSVILYINEHLTESLSLDVISNEFYISKGHLCRIFKASTGYTLNNYIAYKRLLYARELATTGMSWTNASVEAGFGNYSNFYRTYVRTFGVPPRKS